MSITIKRFDPSSDPIWDSICRECIQSTMLHMRLFLSYHKDRFRDQSLMIERDGRVIGLFPAALSTTDSNVVISHPGITYGGVLHRGDVRGEMMLNVMTAIRDHFVKIGCSSLIYKVVPVFYHRAPAQDDLYALSRLGAIRTRCDLSCTIDLQYRLPVSERRRRSLKKAIKAGVEIVEGFKYLPDLWGVLVENLTTKHGAIPVHSLEEIVLLANRFPEHIRCICARLEGDVMAGVVLFVTATTHHAQYIASSEKGYQVSALDRVFEHCIEKAGGEGRRWFDFGISNENQGKVLNEGLYRFKSEFGGGGAVHEFYELDLRAGANGAE